MKTTLNIRLNVDKDFTPKAKYIFDMILNVLGLKAKYYERDTLDDIHIYYGVKSEENYPVKIYRDILTSLEFHRKKIYNNENLDFVRYKEDYIPFLFSERGDIFNVSESSIVINKDIISSAFYLSTDWEEFIGVKEENKLAVAENFAFLPLLEIYADILKTAIMQTVLKQVIVIKPNTDNLFYSLMLIFNKFKSVGQKNSEKQFKEIQKLEHYKRKFFGSRKQNHISIIANDETYLKVFKNVIRDSNEYSIFDNKKLDNLSEKGFFYNSSERNNFQPFFFKLQEKGVRKAICYYYNSVIGYKNFYSHPFKPFDFKNNKPFDFYIIPIVMFSSYFIKNCALENKFLKYEMERIFKISFKYNANIFIGFDILDFYYNCSNKLNLFSKLKRCIRRLKKSIYKPINLEIMEKVGEY